MCTRAETWTGEASAGQNEALTRAHGCSLTCAQLPVPHLGDHERRLWAAQQATHVSQAGAEAHPAHPHATAKALRALHELVRVLRPLPVLCVQTDGSIRYGPPPSSQQGRLPMV